jgi:uncharacterized protein
MTFFLVFLAALVAFSLSTLGGGGAGLLLVPVLARVVPATMVPGALTLGTVASTSSKLLAFRTQIRWDITRWFVPAAIPGVVLGAMTLGVLPPLLLQVFLGFLLLAHVRFLFVRSGSSPETEETGAAQALDTTVRGRLALVVIGFLAGFLSGLTGAVGVLFNRFYFRRGLGPEEVVATRAGNELPLHCLKLALYFGLGLLHREVLFAGAAVAVGALLATLLARRVVSALSPRQFQRLGYAAMVFSGLVMIGAAALEVRRSPDLSAGLERAADGHEIELSSAWSGGGVALEWELGEGFALERLVPLDALPADVRASARERERAAGGQRLACEEVYRWRAPGSFECKFDSADGRRESFELPRVD